MTTHRSLGGKASSLLHPYFISMTSVALMTPFTVSPTANCISSIACQVIAAQNWREPTATAISPIAFPF